MEIMFWIFGKPCSELFIFETENLEVTFMKSKMII